MDLQERIEADIRKAMLERDKDRLNVLRAIKAALMIERTKEGGGGAPDEAAGLRILQKLHKQRTEAAAIYNAQGRKDLAAEEEAQAAVLEQYLPARLSEADITAEVAAVIAELGATSMADMGKVMGAANARLAGKAEGAQVAAIVRQMLSNR